MSSLRTTLWATWLLTSFTGALAIEPACTAITGVEVQERTVTAACGECIFKQTAGKGCYWAVEIDGSYYPVNGPVPKDHDSHGPEGMCRLPRQAVVAGTIRSGQFFATKFELLPVDPGALPLPEHDHIHGG